MKFAFNLPVNIIFGIGESENIGKRAAEFGNKAFLATGRGSAKKSGLLDKTITLLKENKIESVVFDKIEPNPTTTMVHEGAEIVKKENCDFVIGLGGGSILDAAKAIAFASKNSGNIMDYVYGRRPAGNAVPIILIPTTCGTGSEGNGFAVITDPKTGDKKSLRCPSIIAKLSIVDPILMKTMPKAVLASVGFDALCHNMETFIENNAQPLTSLMSLYAVNLINESLCKLYDGTGGDAEWEKLSWASSVGGMCIGISGVAAPHGLEHPASGLKNIVHGCGLSALTPVVYDKSISSVPKKFAKISQSLGGKDEKDCVSIIKDLIDKLKLPKTLSEQGIVEKDIDWMAENALKVSSASLANHPINFGIEDIKEIYRLAM
jgi:alcohol dehydrogenase class IV